MSLFGCDLSANLILGIYLNELHYIFLYLKQYETGWSNPYRRKSYLHMLKPDENK